MAEIQALAESLRVATAGAHAQYLASGGKASSAIIGGQVVNLKNGYPDSGSGGIRRAVVDAEEFTVRSTPVSVTFLKIGAADAAHCAVTYSVSTDTSSAAMVTKPVIGGC